MKKTKYRKPLGEVSNRQKYKRTNEMSNMIMSAAEKQQVTLNELMGVMIHKMNYRTDKSAAVCGLNLQYNCSLDNKLPLSAASFIQLYNNMGKTT